MMMDLLVLLVTVGVALFVLSRLYAVLGKDVGAAPPPPKQKSPAQENTNFVEEPVSSPNFAGLAALQKNDASFDVGRFLSGAKSAYEMIVLGFASGDRDLLRPLLEDEVYNSYDAAYVTPSYVFAISAIFGTFGLLFLWRYHRDIMEL